MDFQFKQRSPFASKLAAKLTTIGDVLPDIGADVVEDLRQNILDEGGDPDTRAAWKALSPSTIKRKQQLGAYLTILRQFDFLRKGIAVVKVDRRVVSIGVTGKASGYAGFVAEVRPFLGFSQEARAKARLRLRRHIYD
jgi:hypothetical protein